ncbi:MAG: phospholipid carrier-dependent glycosyltransferase, partial [bacterium]|nr:phospholipid carrier-dependent glycosyltransferase [bacterium]
MGSDRPHSNLRTTLLCGGAVLCLCVVALALRTYPVYEKVFTPGYVGFQGVDPWCHVRKVDNLVHQFPHLIAHDPYALHPGGQNIAVGPFFDLLLAGAILLAGLGAPTVELTHALTAWFPAVLGALTVPVVYALARSLFDRRVALLAAAFIAVLPGPF